jgi:hypothetical protein
MNRGHKLMAGLSARTKDWDRLSAVGTRGTNTKLVRRDGTGHAAFHKPGSMSGRKGYGKRRMGGKR